MWKCPKCGRAFKNAEQDHFCGNISTIDDYTADRSPDVQPLLHAIRETIRAAEPETIEKMSWQMPAFWQGENIVHFATRTKHISIYSGGEATAAFAERLVGYKTSKGQFSFHLAIQLTMR
ncbi:MAG: DUF1801 domain-containing protein [Christensenellaceae bacterium]|nr:DUF1801 domain-containing protein [Christensenellaceae bacterium]